MGAAKRNNNAGKWTEARVRKVLAKMEGIVRKQKRLLMGELLQELGLYRSIWGYWRNKYAASEEIQEEMDLIKQNFEVNIFTAGCKSEIPPKTTILYLRNAHGWRNSGRVEEEEMILPIYNDETAETKSTDIIPVVPMYKDRDTKVA